jgi:hypothetical protein
MGLSWIIMDFHGDKPIKMGLKWDMGMWEFHGAITNYDSSGDAGYPCYNDDVFAVHEKNQSRLAERWPRPRAQSRTAWWSIAFCDCWQPEKTPTNSWMFRQGSTKV